MGKSQREKGKRIERLIARELAPLWPDVVRSAMQSRGADLPDLDQAPAWIECKGGKAPPIRPALEQARRDRDASVCDLPIMAATHEDRKETLITMPVSDFVALVLEERREAVRVALMGQGRNDGDNC